MELEPDTRKLKKNQTHPIYSMKYLLHRRIREDEPHTRNDLVQWMKWQEFGHTKSYCKLSSVCVVCGNQNAYSQCEAAKSSVSYADTLKSSGASTNTIENSVGFESCFQTITQNLTTFTQNMTNIIASMQNIMQELLRSQNQMLQVLLSKKWVS